MKMSSSLKLLALLSSAPAFATGPAPAENIRIENIAYKGSGCLKEDSASINISDDKQAFTVTFSEFAAQTGPFLTPLDGRKQCNLTLDLNIPAGWQFSIASFNFRGYVGLDQGIVAEHSATYYLQGDARQQKFASVTQGPYADEYVYTDNIGIGSTVWSKCGVKRALNINTAITVRNTDKNAFPNATGFIANDSIDGLIQQVYGLTWRQCS
jgi:hypothetical protein